MEDEEDTVDYYEEDLYQRLGVSREATVEEIRAAFHRQSLKWHPDKMTAKHRDVAERKFKQLAEAHNILSNERKRAIYDKLGYEAVSSLSDRELTPYMSLDDLLKKMKVKKGDERDVDTSLQIRGRVKIHDNFVDPFTRTLSVKPRMMGVGVEQDFEKKLDQYSSLLAGFVFNRFYSNSASGVIYFGYRRLITLDGLNTFYTQVLYGDEISVLRVSATTQFSPKTAGAAIMDFTTNGGNLRLRLFESFAKHLNGNIEYSLGQTNTLSLGLKRDWHDKETTLKSSISGDLRFPCDYSELIPFGLPHFELSWNKEFTKWDSVKAGVGTDLSVSVDYERKINKDISVGVKAAFKHFQLVFTMKAEYMDQAIMLPFYWPQNMQSEILPVFLIPTFGAWFLAHYWLNPLKEREKKRKVAKIRESTAQLREEKRQEAHAEQDLMKYGVERKFADETARRGLVIKRAYYGKITEEFLHTLTSNVTEPSQTESSSGEKDREKEKVVEKEQTDETKDEEESIVEVAIPLQHQVEHAELHLPATSKRTMKGFYDPCPGEKKKLWIEYTYGGILRRVTILDMEEIRLPNDAHIVKQS